MVHTHVLVFLPLLDVTVELGQTLISVNESDSGYVACINKSHSTLRPITVEVVDVPGTALRRIGNIKFSRNLILFQSVLL